MENATSNFVSYKLDEIKEYEEVEVVECRGAVIAHINLTGRVFERELKNPSRINTFGAILCVRGEMALSSSLTSYHLTANSLFMSANTIIQFEPSNDCEFYLIVFDDRFVSELNIDIQQMIPIISYIRNNPQITISEEYVKRIVESFPKFYNEFKDSTASPFREQIIRHQLCSIVYRLCEGAAQYIDIAPQPSVKDRSSEYFRRMMELLAENFRTQRNVEFYADKMNLTAKHLSRVIRNYTGRSVHQWIDAYVVLEIKNLLKYSDMSIQQISYELNFPNPSFMGQYFKRITGKTPGEYKRER